jgi:hypothetical protein
VKKKETASYSLSSGLERGLICESTDESRWVAIMELGIGMETVIVCAEGLE